LHALKARVVTVAVVLGLERHVAGIGGGERQTRRVGKGRIVDRRLPVRGVLRKRHLGERAAAEQRTITAFVRELGGHLLDPIPRVAGDERFGDFAEREKGHCERLSVIGGWW